MLQRAWIIASLYSCFSSLGVFLIYLTHGVWFTVAKELEMPEVVYIDLTVMKTIYLGTPFVILVFVSVFFITFTSERWRRTTVLTIPVDTFFSVASFNAIFIEGITGCYSIPLAFNWVTITANFLVAGVTALSVFYHLYFKKVRKKLDSIKGSISNPNLFAKRLELEHNFHQETIRTITWGGFIFLTGGVLACLIHPLESLPPKLVTTLIGNTVIFGIWMLSGIWFGIIGRISYHMEFLRLSIEKLSTRNEEK